MLDPLEDALDGVRTLVVVPDAELHGVPLDALPQAGGLVGERFAVERAWRCGTCSCPRTRSGARHSSSCSGASFNASPEPQGRESLAMAATGPEHGLSGAADVLRGSPWERGFAPLPATLDEARAIAALFEEGMQATDEPTLLLGKEASRLRLGECAPRARWLHLATHGWFAPESVRSVVDPGPLDESLSTVQRLSREEVVRGTSPMLLCGLALAGANQPPDDLGRIGGILTAAEFSSWDLRQCELAVLSACDTNVGVTRAGQGVASLQLALHMAGARSVITSLWKVPDQATQELMTDFYRRLWFGGRTKARALWEAKMRMRDARDPQGRPRFTPRDWAGWVLSGDPE